MQGLDAVVKYQMIMKIKLVQDWKQILARTEEAGFKLGERTSPQLKQSEWR